MSRDTFELILEDSEAILKKYDLCDNCLGRSFAKRMHVSSNRLLGTKIRKYLQNVHFKCYICRDIFGQLPQYSDRIYDLAKEYSFSTFVIGSILKPSLIDRDDLIRSKFQMSGTDSIKTAISKELTKLLAKKNQARVSHIVPELIITVNFKDESIGIYSRPIYVSARYTKNSRSMPQKQVSCDQCDGHGCRFCDFTGMDNFESVEGRIARFLIGKFKARQVKIAWIGGEDKTSKVDGSGRPFFAKIINPKRRRSRLESKIKLDGIDILEGRMIRSMPQEPIPFRSTIRSVIDTDLPITSAILKRLSGLHNLSVTVSDRTRRYNRKIIYWLRYKKRSSNSFQIDFQTDGGLSIKRFVEGDGITPNISELLKVPCKCARFDFTDIELLQDRNKDP